MMMTKARYLYPHVLVLLVFFVVRICLWSCLHSAATQSLPVALPPLTPSPPALTSNFTSNFRFPSVDERVSYYMGCWAFAESSTWYLQDMSYCNDIRRQGRRKNLWHIDELLHSDLNKKYTEYTTNAYDIMQDSELDIALFQFGDVRVARTMELPIITKTRLSRWAAPPATETCGQNIIWPMKHERHYSPVEKVDECRAMGLEMAWEDKAETLMWRGQDMDNNERESVVIRWFNYDVTTIDVAFSHYEDDDDYDGWLTYKMNKLQNIGFDMRPYSRPDATLQEMIQYKYLLSIEGADIATSLKWMLYADSVVFMRVPTVVSFAMEDLLVPFVHYVPVAEDYSNLAHMVEWAKANDEQCRFIAKQSTEYIKQVWMSDQAQEDFKIIKKRLGDSYRDLYAPRLRSCFQEERIQPASNLTKPNK